MTYHMFSRLKNREIDKRLMLFVSNSGPQLIKLDHVILFEYYFPPFDSARRPSSCLGHYPLPGLYDLQKLAHF